MRFRVKLSVRVPALKAVAGSHCLQELPSMSHRQSRSALS